MKKIFFPLFFLLPILFLNTPLAAQQVKVGVFDISVMVQVMPAYRQVDSLVQVYEKDSLAPEFEIYQSEYVRLDSTYKNDSVLVVAGRKSKQVLNYVGEQRQKMGLNIVYWQQLAQNKSNLKRNQLAQPLYDQVAMAYKRVIDRKNIPLC